MMRSPSQQLRLMLRGLLLLEALLDLREAVSEVCELGTESLGALERFCLLLCVQLLRGKVGVLVDCAGERSQGCAYLALERWTGRWIGGEGVEVAAE